MSTEIKKEIQLEIAHVLFIDIVGYSKLLMDEQRAAVDQLTQIVRATEQFQKADASERLSKIATGDGMALVFYTTPEAPVRCAVELSHVLKDYPQLRLRMGIHSGPVGGVIDVTGRTNLAGAGLNVAQRVMKCGDGGHILLSKHVAEDLEEYEEWRQRLHDLGTCEVKHGVRIGIASLYDSEVGNPQLPKKLQVIKRHRSHVRWTEVAVALLVLAAIATVFGFLLRRPTRSALAIAGKSIAVLPFENLSEDKANAYFTEGIMDEILTKLGTVRDLKVISRTSTAKYQSKPDNLKKVAQELGVSTVLEGSVQKADDKVRVNVQLINALTDAHLWAETYDRKLTDVFGVESEIAKTVADIDLYLKGRFFWNKRTSVDMKTALGYFEQAANADPNYAVAYAGMADCYLLLPLYGGGVPIEMYPKAITMAQKAISLDPSLGEPHASIGLVHALFHFDFLASVREFEEAIRLNPNYATAHHWFGDSVLPALGQFDRANAEAKRALELDPLSVVNNTDAGTVFWLTGRYQEAVPQFRKALEMDPRNYTAHWQLAQALECVGNLPGAIAEYEKAIELDDDPVPLGLLAAAKAKAGDRAAAFAILNRLEEIAKDRYVPDYSFALIHLALGQNDEAMKWLESSYAKHQPDVNWIRVDPDLRPLHSDPRFEALAEKIVPAREFNAQTASK